MLLIEDSISVSREVFKGLPAFVIMKENVTLVVEA